MQNDEVVAYIEEVGTGADSIKGLTPEHVALMIFRMATNGDVADGARVRAQELLAKWKGMFVDRVENVGSTQDAETLLAQIEAFSPTAAEALRRDLGMGGSVQ